MFLCVFVDPYLKRRNEQALALTNGHQRDEMARQHSEEDQRARGGAIDLASSKYPLKCLALKPDTGAKRKSCGRGIVREEGDSGTPEIPAKFSILVLGLLTMYQCIVHIILCNYCNWGVIQL